MKWLFFLLALASFAVAGLTYSALPGVVPWGIVTMCVIGGILMTGVGLILERIDKP